MPRINTGLERSRSPSHSGSDSEVEEKPLSLTRQRRTAAQHTSSAWAALVPVKKGHDGEEEETYDEEKVEHRRSLASQSSAARGNRFKKTASPASRKSEFETPKSINVEVVCPRVESPKLSSVNKASPIKPKAEASFMDQDQLESIEKEVEKHRNEADKVASANESALEAEESPTRNGDSSISQNVVPDFGNESAKPSGRGRGRGGGRGSRGGRGGGTPGRGRGASRLTMPTLPNMPGGPRAMVPNRGGGMPAQRMGNFSQYGNQPPVGKWLMENGEGRAPMKVLRLRASGPTLSNANSATGTMPPKPITSIATSNAIAAPSNFSKEVGELSAKLANRNISGSTAKELTDLVTQLQEELDRVKEDRQKLIANNREYVDQMQLSHATALDIKDSRIRQLESTLEKLQANYDSSLKRIEHLVLKHEVDGPPGGAKINSESAPKISAQPQRINVAQILESKNILANTSKPVPQKHPASTSSYSSMDEPPPKIARAVPHIRVQDQRVFSQQLRDSVLAAKERREMGDESMSDSEARDELEDEEFDEEDPMMDTIMETQRQLFESGLP